MSELTNYAKSGKVKVLLNSEVSEILDNSVIMRVKDSAEPKVIENDLVYIFAGGILPTKFLEEIGIKNNKEIWRSNSETLIHQAGKNISKFHLYILTFYHF